MVTKRTVANALNEVDTLNKWATIEPAPARCLFFGYFLWASKESNIQRKLCGEPRFFPNFAIETAYRAATTPASP